MSRKRKSLAAVIICAAAAVFLYPRIAERVELNRRHDVCNEYLASADISLGFSVEFDITWEKEVYGREDYMVREIDPQNAGEEDLRILRQIVDSLEYNTDDRFNKDTESRDACGEDAMRIKVACRNGGHILLTWSYGGDSCMLTACDEDDTWLACAAFKVSAEASDALRARGGLPPIPTLEQIIEAGRRKKNEEAVEPKTIEPTWYDKD